MEHCEVEERGLSEAMAIQEQFGNPDSVVRAFLLHVTESPTIDKGDKPSIIQLRNHFHTCLRILRPNE